MRRFLTSAALAVCVGLGAAPALGQTDFNWNGQLAPGQSIEIRGINGEIRAVAARGGDVLVTAVRSARKSNPAEVRFEVVSHGGGITICAVYPAPDGEPANECRAGGGGRSNTRNNDTVVDFSVQVPRGVNFIGSTVNGSVDGEGLPANADGHTVNGSINLSAAGVATGNSVNGSITASMGRADFANGARFKTVNGDITLRLPANTSAQLHAETLNGAIRSDFPIQVTLNDNSNRKRVDGTIGNGGQTLELSSVNGSLNLYKR